MAKYIQTSITINADKEKIWTLLTDWENYPNWNPFIQSISGEVKEGHRIQIQLPGMTFKPKILTFHKNTELKWLGHLGFKGIFDGEHRFKLAEAKDGTTYFEQSERFSGLLVHLFPKKLYRNTKEGFEKMNQALKLLAER